MVKPARPQCNIKPVIHRHPLQMSHWSGPHWLFPQVLGGGKCFILFSARWFMPQIPFMFTEEVQKSGYFYFEYFKDVMRAHSTPLTSTFRFLFSPNDPVALKRSVFKQHKVSPACKSSLQKWERSTLHFLPQCLSQCVMMHFSLLAPSLYLPPGCVSANTQVKLLFTEFCKTPPGYWQHTQPGVVSFQPSELVDIVFFFLNTCKMKHSKGYSRKLNLSVAATLLLCFWPIIWTISKTNMHLTPCSILIGLSYLSRLYFWFWINSAKTIRAWTYRGASLFVQNKTISLTSPWMLSCQAAATSKEGRQPQG